MANHKITPGMKAYFDAADRIEEVLQSMPLDQIPEMRAGTTALIIKSVRDQLDVMAANAHHVESH